MSQALMNVDWDLLHEQKLVLLEMLNNVSSESIVGQALSGIIHLLDSLQDEAVEQGRWQFPKEHDEEVHDVKA